MTTEEQRIAIAEACGWKYEGRIHGQPFGEHPDRHCGMPFPDYLSDLNAMAEAEKVLTKEQFDRYADILCDMVAGSDPDPNVSGLLTVTAAQKAEAFVMATGRWVLTGTPF